MEEVKAVLEEFERFLSGQYEDCKERIIRYEDLTNDEVNRLRGAGSAIRTMMNNVASRRKKLTMEFLEDDAC